MSSRRKASRPVSLNILTSGKSLTGSTSKGGVSKKVTQPDTTIKSLQEFSQRNIRLSEVLCVCV